MEKASTAFSASIFTAISLLVSTLFIQGVEGSIIGVNYGTVANNLPPPEQGIAVTVTATNDQIPNLTRIEFAQEWLKLNVRTYIPATNIVRIFVGNEVISTANKLLIASLVPAMETLHTALVGASLDRRIKISTPHSLGILSGSSSPSTGKFRQGYDTHVLKPLLSFLRDTNSPFMINPYPFFGSSPENSRLRTGDSSQADVDAESAAQYNRNLMQHVTSGGGTPLMPNRTFETYIFALFNEDLKPGPTCERNFGLFRPGHDSGVRYWNPQ
ncbi:GLUCAN ENDO-13-BETA-GLUCOSIDASE BG1-RELATED-RELATED, partial [Salix viminalis]